MNSFEPRSIQARRTNLCGITVHAGIGHFVAEEMDEVLSAKIEEFFKA